MPPQIPITSPLPTPLPPNLHATLQSRLITANAIPPLLTSLQTACAGADWEDALHARVLELLREGEVGSREELVRRVVGEVRGDEGEGEGDNGKGKGKEGEGGKGKKTDIRIPKEGIRAGTKIVREVLEGCVDVQPEVPGKDFWA